MKKLKRILSSILALMLALTVSTMPVSAESATATTLRLAKTTGTVVVKNSSGKSQSIKTDMRLYNGYTIATEKSSEAYISLDGTKAVKLDASGKASVKKSGNKLEVCLESGELYFNVTEPLAADESLNIRTSTMVTGVRGSYGWVTRTEVGLMHGHVTLTCINPVTGQTRVTEIYSGERVYYDPASEVQGDPELKEIDFIKEPITNEDVPAFVVEEMRGDETLQTPVIEDVPTVDVPALLGDYEEIRAGEEAAAAEQEAALAEQLAEQEQTIAEDPTDYLFEDELVVGEGGGGYTVTLPETRGVLFEALDPVSGIEAGTEFHFHIAPQDGFVLYEEYLQVTAGNAEVSLEAENDGFNASFIVNGNTTVSLYGVVYQASSFQDAIRAFGEDDDYVELIEGQEEMAEPTSIGEHKTLILNSEVNLTMFEALTNNGTIINYGYMLIAEGATLTNYGTIINRGSLEVGEYGVLTNYHYDTLINEGVLSVSGDFNNGDGELSTAARVVNESSGEFVISETGSFFNKPHSKFENNGTLEVLSGQDGFWGKFFNYSNGDAGLTNNGSLQIYGSFVNGDEDFAGSVVNADGAELTITSSGTFFNNPSSAIANNGSLTLVYGGFFMNDSDVGLTNTSQLVIEGDFYNGDNDDISGRLVNSGTVSVSGLFTNKRNGTVINSGSFSHQGDQPSTRMLDNDGVFTNTNGGTVSTTRSMFNFANGIFRNDGVVSVGQEMRNQGSFTNNGTFSVEGYLHNNGSLVNNASMSVCEGYNGSAEGGPFGPGSITNTEAATLGIQSGHTFRNCGDGTIVNSGVIELLGENENSPTELLNVGTVENAGTIAPAEDHFGTVRSWQAIRNCEYTEIEAYTITFHANGGVVEITALVIPYGYSVASYALPEPTMEGYDFDGWYHDEDLTDPWPDGSGEPILGDMDAWAKWVEATP